MRPAGGRLRREDGQVVSLLAVGLLVALLGVAAIVIDVGHAYVVKHKLQAMVDASALAAADALPSATQAQATALTYVGRNADVGSGVVLQQASVQPWCLKSVSYCFGNAAGAAPPPGNDQANGVVVKETATVPTTFMKLFGVPTMTVHASATACGMCGSQPLDVALVVDRTGSMADNMQDLISGVRTFLGSLDPNLDHVSLLVLPPKPSYYGSYDCYPAPALSALPLGFLNSYSSAADNGYLLVDDSSDYRSADGTLNSSSKLVQDVNCLTAGGSTAYKQALAAAQADLQSLPARKGVQRVVVFESDGAANTAPDSYYDAGSDRDVHSIGTLYQAAAGHLDDVERPCGSAVDYAKNQIQADGTLVYTVAYNVGPSDQCFQAPHYVLDAKGKVVATDYQQTHEGGITAPSALAAMASPGGAFTAGDEATMDAAFAKIANKIVGASLVPDSEAQ